MTFKLSVIHEQLYAAGLVNKGTAVQLPNKCEHQQPFPQTDFPKFLHFVIIPSSLLQVLT